MIKHRPLCAFCVKNVVTVTETSASRMGKDIKRVKVTGGYLLSTGRTNGLPICITCWGKVIKMFMPKRDNKGRFTKEVKC